MENGRPLITVFYNSACPVCDAGIARQRARMAGDDEIAWTDINAEPAALADRSIDIDDVRLRLHLVDEDGTVNRGVDAFRVLWARTPGQRLLASVVSWRPVRRLSTVAYDAFARLLYVWNRRRGRW